MSSLHAQVKKLKYDRRLLELSLKMGEITKAEHDKHLQSLEDCSERAKKVKIYGGTSEENSSAN